jgi:heme-degrading monooxygenase HmoA
MYARVSTYVGPPHRLEEAVRLARESSLPLVRRLDGFLGMTYLVDRERGKAMTLTFWATEAALKRSDAAAERLRRESALRLGENVSEVSHYEVAVADFPAPGVARRPSLDEAVELH